METSNIPLLQYSISPELINLMNIFRDSIKKIKIFFLRAIAGITDVLHMTKKFISDSPKNCLIISTTGIGDTIWGTPAIRALKEHFPGINIRVLAKAGGAEIFRENPLINRIFVFRKGVANLFSLFRELRRGHFDTVVVFHATDRIIWLMAYLTGAGKIIGSKRHSKEIDFVITQPVEIPHNTHAIHARHLLIRELGVKSDSKKIELFIADQEKRHINTFLKECGIRQDSFVIGFQPGAAKPYKRWPEKNFIKLGKMLSANRDNIRIIITGNNREKELAQKIANEISAISLAGKLTLLETSAVIERCNIFITNDTGPMHIAVALETPIIALFSATGEENIAPYRSIKTFTVISKPKPCEECISKACTEPVCMEQITPKEVFEKAKELITDDHR